MSTSSGPSKKFKRLRLHKFVDDEAAVDDDGEGGSQGDDDAGNDDPTAEDMDFIDDAEVEEQNGVVPRPMEFVDLDGDGGSAADEQRQRSSKTKRVRREARPKTRPPPAVSCAPTAADIAAASRAPRPSLPTVAPKQGSVATSEEPEPRREPETEHSQRRGPLSTKKKRKRSATDEDDVVVVDDDEENEKTAAPPPPAKQKKNKQKKSAAKRVTGDQDEDNEGSDQDKKKTATAKPAAAEDDEEARRPRPAAATLSVARASPIAAPPAEERGEEAGGEEAAERDPGRFSVDLVDMIERAAVAAGHDPGNAASDLRRTGLWSASELRVSKWPVVLFVDARGDNNAAELKLISKRINALGQLRAESKNDAKGHVMFHSHGLFVDRYTQLIYASYNIPTAALCGTYYCALPRVGTYNLKRFSELLGATASPRSQTLLRHDGQAVVFERRCPLSGDRDAGAGKKTGTNKVPRSVATVGDDDDDASPDHDTAEPAGEGDRDADSEDEAGLLRPSDAKRPTASSSRPSSSSSTVVAKNRRMRKTCEELEHSAVGDDGGILDFPDITVGARFEMAVSDLEYVVTLSAAHSNSPIEFEVKGTDCTMRLANSTKASVSLCGQSSFLEQTKPGTTSVKAMLQHVSLSTWLGLVKTAPTARLVVRMDKSSLRSKQRLADGQVIDCVVSASFATDEALPVNGDS